MANTITVGVHSAPSLGELKDKLNQFYNRFLVEHKKVLKAHGFSLRTTLYGQPHDAAVGIDTVSVIIVACKGTSTDTSSTEHYLDLTTYGTVQPYDLIQSVAREFGWQNMTHLVFSRALLNATDEEQKREFVRLSEDIVGTIEKKQELARTLGITEALTYLENARKRFDMGEPAGYSDCKANCRNALLSLIQTLTQTDRIRDGIKKLHSEGLLGERETEIVESIEDLTARLHGLASKTGSHPPMADADDALFTLRLTDAVVTYITSIVAKARGL